MDHYSHDAHKGRKHFLALFFLPLKTESMSASSPNFRYCSSLQCGQGHIKTYEMCRLVSGFFRSGRSLLILGVEPRNGFWPYRALNTFIPKQGWRTLFSTSGSETRKFVITRPHPRIFTVVLAAAPPRHQKPTPEENASGERTSRCFLPNHGASSSNAGTSLSLAQHEIS